MDERNEPLWQGGPWEQPSPVVVPLPPEVNIPDPKRRRSRRHVLFFSLTLALIAGSTALSVWFISHTPREEVRNPAPPPHVSAAQSEEFTQFLPTAPTGTGVTVPVVPPQGQVLTLTQAYEKNAPSIVALHALAEDGVSQGTGIILTKDGYIITNAHIVEGASKAVVTLTSEQDYEARLVGVSPRDDLAVLKIDAQDLEPAEFGDSTLLHVGDRVSAIGNPMGYRLTMTSGIVSALDRPLELSGNTMYLLQTDTAINFGSSGGALFNDRGQVVGVTTVKIISSDGASESMGFAIPTQRVKFVVDQLIAGEEIITPMLGITVRHTDSPNGLSVEEIQLWSNAWKQGMEVGDVIVSVNGDPISHTQELDRIKKFHKIGDILTMSVLRDGQPMEFSICLQEDQDGR